MSGLADATTAALVAAGGLSALVIGEANALAELSIRPGFVRIAHLREGRIGAVGGPVLAIATSRLDFAL
jgi:hypothetical protein